MRHEEVVVVEIAIHAPGNLRGLGAEGWTSTLQEDDDNDASNIGLGVGGKPAVAGTSLGAVAGLSQNLFFVEIDPQASCGAVAYLGGHPLFILATQCTDSNISLPPPFNV